MRAAKARKVALAPCADAPEARAQIPKKKCWARLAKGAAQQTFVRFVFFDGDVAEQGLLIGAPRGIEQGSRCPSAFVNPRVIPGGDQCVSQAPIGR